MIRSSWKVAAVILAACAPEYGDALLGTPDHRVSPLEGESDVIVEVDSEARARSRIRTYEVTVENLSTVQDLSPGLLVVHRKATHLWRDGELASEGLRLVAEQGDPSVALDALSQDPHVAEAVKIDTPLRRVGGPVTPGGPQGPSTRTFTITAHGRANRLSAALMVICTNDGFVGLDSVLLPNAVGESATYHSAVYDSGTEVNTEANLDIIDACYALPPDGQNERPAECRVISAHRNIQGHGDLCAADLAWEERVAAFHIRRLQ